MRQILVLALASLAFINANPLSIDNNKIGNIITANVHLSAQASNNVDETIITGILALLNQQAALVGSGASAGQDDKIALLKSMLKKEIDVPTIQAALAEAVPEPKAASAEEPKSREADIMKKVEYRLAQIKARAQNFEMPASFNMPTKHDISEKVKSFKLPEHFKIPEGIKLPEKFAEKLESRRKQIKQL